MLSIRFSRIGKKKQPIYRIIVTEKTRDPWGKYLEILGSYNPRSKVAELKADRIKYWISKGAQPSATINNLLVTHGVINSEKVRASKSQPGKKKSAKIASDKAEAESKAKADLSAEASAKAEAQATEAAKADSPAKEAGVEKPAEAPVENIAEPAPIEEVKPE
ncbi:MAG: 30S ribosomal protein S16 [Patescibacteria group bacterium]